MDDIQITIVHGGQTGVDRGGHEAAIANAWPITGYMPRDMRDELGQIPEDVRRFLTPHTSSNYAARTEANVQDANAVLIVVPDRNTPRATPGTAKTIDLAASYGRRYLIVDPTLDPDLIANWIYCVSARGTLTLPFLGTVDPPLQIRLLVAGPRTTKWASARIETAALLRRVASVRLQPQPIHDLTSGER